jgi:hypothetical protein
MCKTVAILGGRETLFLGERGVISGEFIFHVIGTRALRRRGRRGLVVVRMMRRWRMGDMRMMRMRM